MLWLLPMTELEFIKLLLDNCPWAKLPAVESFIAKATVSLKLNDPIDRNEEFMCDVGDLIRDYYISFARQFKSCFSDPDAFCESMRCAIEMKKQMIRAEADAYRKLSR